MSEKQPLPREDRLLEWAQQIEERAPGDHDKSSPDQETRLDQAPEKPGDHNLDEADIQELARFREAITFLDDVREKVKTQEDRFSVDISADPAVREADEARGRLIATGWQWQKSLNNLALANRQMERADRHLARMEESIDEVLVEISVTLRDSPGMHSLRHQVLQKVLRNQTIRSAEELAQTLVRRDKLQDALEVTSEITEIDDSSAEIAYREARAFAKICIELDDAVASGDQVWESLRDLPEFQQILASMNDGGQ